jgi:hypothetical protein
MQLQKMFSLAALFAAVTISGCGGSGSSDSLPTPTPPPPVDLSKIDPVIFIVDTPKISGDFQYSETNIGTTGPIRTADPVTDVITVTGTMDGSKIGTFSGIAGTVNVKATSSNLTGKKNLFIELAAGGDTKELQIHIKKNGALDNGCLPTAIVSVAANGLSSKLSKYGIELSSARFSLPGFCPSATATNPDIDATLTDVSQIQVEDKTLPAATATKNISITIGDIGAL